MSGFICEIHLIFTTHTNNGRCNSSELTKIIEKIKPEVIYEELPLSLFNECYIEHKHKTLETIAIKEYLKKYKISHFPVDTYELPISYHLQNNINNKLLIRSSIEYNELIHKKILQVQENGFIFLNSEIYEKYLALQNKIEEQIINEGKKTKIVQDFLLSKEVDNKREYEWLKNIMNYSKTKKYKTGLLLIGADHRITFIRKIMEYKKNDDPIINWIFKHDENVFQ
jgi:hypothetical protein